MADASQRCPNCLAPVRAAPGGLCAYCGAHLPLIHTELFPASPANATGDSILDDKIYAEQAGVPPDPRDAALLHLPPPKPKPLPYPEDADLLDLAAGSTPPSDTQAATLDFAPHHPHHFQPQLTSAGSLLDVYAGQEPLEDTEEAQEFLHSFDEPKPAPASASEPTASFIGPPPPDFQPSFFEPVPDVPIPPPPPAK